jgi:hypothetical protein
MACAEEGTGDEEDGDVLDCGDHGFAHGEHCHCDTGYLFNGETCVLPEAITTPCEEHEEHEGEEAHEGEEEHEGEEAHHHGACVCPDEGVCPCDGDIETHSGQDYCLPELHAEDE